MMAQPTDIGRLHLDQYMTPDEDAERLFSAWAKRLTATDTVDSHVVMEPSAGKGGWLKAIQKAWWTGDRELCAIDLDPTSGALAFEGLHENLDEAECADFLTVTVCEDDESRIEIPLALHPDASPDEWNRPDLIIGNPPYGKAVFIDCKTCDGTGVAHYGSSDAVESKCAAKGCKGGRVRRKKDEPVAEKHIRRALAVSKRHVVFLLRQGIMSTKKRVEKLWSEHPPRHFWSLGWRPSFMEHVGKKGGDRYDYVLVWWDNAWTGPTTWSPLPRTAPTSAGAAVSGVEEDAAEPGELSLDDDTDMAGAPIFALPEEASPAPQETPDVVVDLASFRSPAAGPEYIFDLLSFQDETP